ALEQAAVCFEHGDLAVGGQVRFADFGLAAQRLDLFAGQEIALRVVAGVDHADHRALAGILRAAVLLGPDAIAAGQVQVIGAGVVGPVLLVRRHRHDSGLLGQLRRLQSGQLGHETVHRRREALLDFHAFGGSDVVLLIGQVRAVLLGVGGAVVQLLALGGLGGRNTGHAALV